MTSPSNTKTRVRVYKYYFCVCTGKVYTLLFALASVMTPARVSPKTRHWDSVSLVGVYTYTVLVVSISLVGVYTYSVSSVSVAHHCSRCA